jgi:hypothetical protein
LAAKRPQAGRHLVFVSHSSRDTWVAKQLAREIADCGAAVFLDEAHIEVGMDFEQSIRAALEEADEMVVLLTPWALERPYVWAELGAAWLRGIPIAGVLHGLAPAELQGRREIPVFLKERNLLDLNDVGRYLGELRSRVHKGTGA